MPVVVECEACGESFETYPSRIKRGGGRFCSRDCAHPKRGEDRECAACGEVFYVQAAKIRAGYGFYCSNECADPGRGCELDEHPNWSGGEYIDVKGYRWVLCDDGSYVAEHRLVMEQKLGRRLKQDEHVHHRNENKLDNRPSNLEVINSSEHAVYHNKKRAKDRKRKSKKRKTRR